jgi:hypothetical protein
MFDLKPEVISSLRSMVLAGRRPSEMLRMIISTNTPEKVNGLMDRVIMVKYFSEAFCFDSNQASAIFGWLPDGTGHLNDTQVDHLLARRIEQTKKEWSESPALVDPKLCDSHHQAHLTDSDSH